MASDSLPAGRRRAPRDGGASSDEDAPDALAFVHDMGALARRFVLAEVLAPALALRRRAKPRPVAEASAGEKR